MQKKFTLSTRNGEEALTAEALQLLLLLLVNKANCCNGSCSTP